jgi:hypothetical protein
VAKLDDVWLPLVDEPLGTLVERIAAGDAEVERLVDSPRRMLAFRTFAYIRVGLVLGQLIFDDEVPPYDGSGAWVENLLRDDRHRGALAREVRAVAEEVAADPGYAREEPIGPDDAARERLRSFVRARLHG